MMSLDLGWWRVPDGRRALLCWNPHSGEVVLHWPDGFRNDVLAVVPSEPELRKRIDGWEHHCGNGNGLAWLAGQLEGVR